MECLVGLLVVGVLIAAVLGMVQLSSLKDRARRLDGRLYELERELADAKQAFWRHEQRLRDVEAAAARGALAAQTPSMAAELAAPAGQTAPAPEAQPAVAAPETANGRAQTEPQPAAVDMSRGPLAAAAAREAATADESQQARAARRKAAQAVVARGRQVITADSPQADSPQAPPSDQRQPSAQSLPQQSSGAGVASSGDDSVPPSEPMGLEQWLGVRGAAVLGAALLVLAGGYFFKYSVDHELISPAMRVVMGVALGIVCLVGSETWIRSRHELLANALGGTGVAILYLAFWAALARYQLIGTTVAALLMILVTAAACVLCVYRRSLALALFGLAGGFATPIMLSTGSDRPIALFSYLLLLDVALLVVARHRGWTLLTALSLLASAGYQAYWILAMMGPDRLLLGMGIALAFAALFVFGPRELPPATEASAAGAGQGSTRSASRAETPLWTIRVAGMFLPFLFAFYFGARAELTPHWVQTGAFALLLVTGALWVGWRQGVGGLGVGAAGAALGVQAAWLLTHRLHGGLSWEVVAYLILLAALTQGASELQRWRPVAAKSAALPPAAVALLGGLLLSAFAAAAAKDGLPWPWLVVGAALGALALRAGTFSGSAWLELAAPGGAALLLLVLGWRPVVPLQPSEAVMIAAMVLLAVAHPLGSLLLGPGPARRLASHGSALLALTLLFVLPSMKGLGVAPYMGASLMAALLVCLAAARGAGAPWILVGAFVVAPVQWWRAEVPVPSGGELSGAYLGHGLGLVLLMAFPFLLGRAAREQRWPYRVAALVGPAFFLTALELHDRIFGRELIAAVPIALGAATLAAGYALRWRGPSAPEVRRSALAWIGAAALAFVTVAIPLQLRNEWVTIGWSLQGLATLMLWRRVDHAGLKYFALVLLGAVTVRLVGNPYVLDYHPRGSLRILNWLSYAYLVPAACLVGAFFMLRGLELGRLRSWERSHSGRPLGAYAVVVAAIVVVFVWVNLTIFDWFSPARSIELSFERLPARDLTMSIAWAVYALLLFAIGVNRTSRGLRGLSLTMMLVTCGKVFLYDLGHLSDLYRVVSLVGLALSLILISLAYKRFVFRGDRAPRQESKR